MTAHLLFPVPRRARSGRTTLTLLRGASNDDSKVLRLLRAVHVNNRRRLSQPESNTQSTDPLQALVPDDRHTLDSWRELVEKLRGREGRKRATRILRRESAADRELRRLGARMARHCGQQCSLTGVRVAALSLRDTAAQTEVPCEAVSAPATTPSMSGAHLAGVFRIPRRRLAESPVLHLTLHNVLGRTRPLVPLYITAEVGVGLSGTQRRVRRDGGIFVYAEELEPGRRQTLACSATGLLDDLPVPAGLVADVTLYVWLPTPAGEHEPRSNSSTIRLLAS